MLRILTVLLLAISPAFAIQRVQGWCERGAAVVVAPSAVSGSPSTRSFQQSYPRCTVTVYNYGTTDLATIYSDGSSTPLADPFTADQYGHWYFYAANGSYDVRISGGGLATPYTFGSISVIDPQRIGGVRYADTFPGADACLKIQAAIADLPSVGGVVDARGIQGDQPCSVNPFATPTPSVLLLLGATTYQTSAAWVVPQKSRMVGINRGDPGINSAIQATSSFPINTPVVSLCGAAQTPCFGVQVEHLTIDCNGVSGCIGAYNAYSQEQSWFQHILITNAPNVGMLIDGSPNGVPTYAQQNSGPYQDLEIYPAAAAVANTVCFKITLTVVAFRGLDGLTCNPDGYAVRPTNGVVIEGSASLTNIHVEHVTNGISLGTTANAAYSVLVNNLEAGPDVPTAIRITAGGGGNTPQNITILNVSNATSSSNNVVDAFNSITLDNSTDVGLYQIGTGAAGDMTIISTRSDLGPNFRGPNLTVKKNLLLPGTANNDSSITMGLGSAMKIVYHDFPAVAGTNAPTIQTGGAVQGRPCLIVQASDASTQGPVGGGTCIWGTGSSADPSFGGIGAGFNGDGSTYYARGTTAAAVRFNDGVIEFLSNAGLTPGNTYSPTVHVRVGGSNIVSVDGTAGYSGTKVAGSCSITVLYGIITNITGC